MYKHHYEEGEQLLTLVLNGELTISNLHEIKEAVSGALGKSDNVLINHSNASEYDFSYIQLLVSAVKTSLFTGKNLTFSAARPEEFQNLIKDSGFNNTGYFADEFKQ